MTEFFLRALAELGWEARLSPKNFSRAIEEVNKAAIVKPWRVLRAFGRYIKNLIDFSPDLIVFFTSTRRIGLFVDSLFILPARMVGIPYVYYIHTQGPYRIYSQGGLGRALTQRFFKHAKACLVLGKIFQDQIRTFYEGPIHVIPNCLENHWLIAPKTNDPDRPAKILFLSNIDREKGVLTLIRAIPLVLAEHPQARFIIAGPWQDENLRGEAMNLVERLDLEQSIDFPGLVYGETKADLYRNSDIFVLPSDFEAFAIVNLEAMRAALPIVTTAVGAMPEVIIDGRSGYLIPPQREDLLAERINILAANPRLRQIMGAEGRRQFERLFSFPSYTLRLGEIMSNIIGKGTL